MISKAIYLSMDLQLHGRANKTIYIVISKVIDGLLKPCQVTI